MSSEASYPRTTNLDVLGDGSIVTAGRVFGCDVATFESGVTRLDGTGSILWERSFEIAEGYMDVLAPGSTDKIAVSISDPIMVIYLSGEPLGSWGSPVRPVQAMLWDSDTTLLMLADTVLLKMKWDGTPSRART